MATRKKKSGYIKHGSDAHKALLGIDRQDDEKEKSKLQAALDAGPPPVMSDKEGVVNRQSWPQGQVMFDGWKRQGR